MNQPTTANGFMILSYMGRTADYSGQLTQKDGSAFLIGPLDKLRLKVLTVDGTLLLDLLSGAPSAAGSFINIISPGTEELGDNPALPATYEFRIAQGDNLGVIPGPGSAEIAV